MRWVTRGSGFKQLGLWWIVAVVVGGGGIAIALGEIRLGGQIMASGFLLGAVMRSLKGPLGSGGLRVRGKAMDVLMWTGLAAATLYASATVQLGPG